MLHGDTFGYIDEFEKYIPLLAVHFKVIAVGMRGHGKSEPGNKTYSYKLFAEDAIAVLKNETNEKASVMGFSAGAITTYYLAAYFPESVKNAVTLGGLIDSYVKIEEFIRIYKLIPNSQLAIIPKCGHVGLVLKPVFLAETIIPFLTETL